MPKIIGYTFRYIIHLLSTYDNYPSRHCQLLQIQAIVTDAHQQRHACTHTHVYQYIYFDTVIQQVTAYMSCILLTVCIIDTAPIILQTHCHLQHMVYCTYVVYNYGSMYTVRNIASMYSTEYCVDIIACYVHMIYSIHTYLLQYYNYNILQVIAYMFCILCMYYVCYTKQYYDLQHT